ncbi:MAG: hypothetical protein CK551_00435 [Planctomycetaceae bacterium]|nr:MAG: hypothetical protein CK551_00435 [Planctomycetaceae bacterium]
MTGEISYDIAMDADNSFVEGSYRVGDGAWQVFIVSKRDVTEAIIKPSTWGQWRHGCRHQTASWDMPRQGTR